MKNITIIGSGYVGLVTGTCLAELGNKVMCIDCDINKIEKLKNGEVPIYEPNLEPMLKHNMELNRLSFSSDIEQGIKHGDIIFIAVGTPSNNDGSANLSFIENVAKQIANIMDNYKIIVEKSTVPVKTGEWVKQIISKISKIDFDVVSNPEFLREGSAVNDFMHPDRIVIGVESKKAENIMLELYISLGAPIIITDIKSAEIIKHASNSFLALKISYINAIANICEKVGADIEKVAEGMGYDKRIGRSFLDAGIGYGGSCFPKDISAFIKIAEEIGYDFRLLKEVQYINKKQKESIFHKIEELVFPLNNKTIGILGLAFKPNTDDIREAPSIEIINQLLKERIKIRVYDPAAMPNMKKIIPNITYCKSAYEVAENADCLLILTEWDEFKELSFKILKEKMKFPNIVDGRNIYDTQEVKEMGFNYISIGR